MKDVQPIFAEHCYQCHGAKRSEAGLRLDHKASAMKGSDNGPAIRPGDAHGSVLVYAIGRTDAKLKMPKKGDPLTPEEIGRIVAWINQGANWPDNASASLVPKAENHWAFKPPVKVAPPALAPHPVDAFIRARLAKENLKPSPPAAPEKLIRRLHLDLTGLPPSPQEVDAFVKDGSPGAYKRAVDRLLASPHYGERWGRHWLDAAHYADSNGYEKDPMRHIWFYRDWVINAFNRDLPYDRFIIEQLAGDLLPGATQDQIVATGFLRNSMINEEGGVDPEQFRMEAMFDRMDVIGKSILGLTINCCQCHNHKYDPVTQEDYYRMFAFLNNDNEPWRVVYNAGEQMQRAHVMRRIAELEAKLKHEHADWPQRMEAWEESVKHDQPVWRVLQTPFIDDTTGGQKFLPQGDGSYLAQSYAPTRSVPKFEIEVKDAAITAFRLELLNDPNLPAYGPGRSQKGVCALSEFVVEVAPTGDAGAKAKPVKFAARRPILASRTTRRWSVTRETRTARRTSASPGRSATPSMARTTPRGGSTPVRVAATSRARRSSFAIRLSTPRRARS